MFIPAVSNEFGFEPLEHTTPLGLKLPESMLNDVGTASVL